MIAGPRGSKWLRLVDGLALVAMYRISLKCGMLTCDELQSILGDAAMYYLAPTFTILSFIIFGLTARLYFRYRP